MLVVVVEEEEDSCKAVEAAAVAQRVKEAVPEGVQVARA